MNSFVRWCRARAEALAVVLLAGAPFASAQLPTAAPQVEQAESPLACLQVLGASGLEYPAGTAELGRGALLRVRLTFRVADGPPQAEVFYDNAGDPFRSAVIERVRRYRLPCLQTGQAPLVATQEFAFSPRLEPPVRWADMREEESPRSSRFLACLTGLDEPPSYPRSMGDDRVLRGTVLVRFRFVAPDQPPEVKVLFDGGSKRFARTVERHAAAYRLTCLKASEAPVHVNQMYRFTMEGDNLNYLLDGSLIQFVAGLEDPAKGQPRFDFNTMGCPFSVRFMLRQPYLANGVGEIGPFDPNRREFIEWLRNVRLKVKSDALAVLIGSSMTISVPCTVLDLT